MNKKNLTKKALNIATAMLCVSLLYLVSCQDENKSAIYDPSQPVAVTSFTPDSGRISEMVLLDGANFGTDTSNIRVYFNSKKAATVSSTGTRILALVPRLPGDTCVVTVEVGGNKATYPERFRYKIAATATTFAGQPGNTGPVVDGLIPKDARFDITYLGIDKNDNIYASSGSDNGMLMKFNEKEQTSMRIATAAHGMETRFQINAHPETGVMMMGAEGATLRNNFLFCDPEEGWVPKNRYIKEWILNDYELPVDDGSERVENPVNHYHCLYCLADGHYYTRYTGGHIVKINPTTWVAEIVAMTTPGIAYGMVFHPKRTSELWIGYANPSYHGIFTLDVTDPTNTFTQHTDDLIGGFRDGKLSQALFKEIRQINFDNEGNLFVGDSDNNCIRKIDTETMIVETIIGIPGVAGYVNGKKEDAQFQKPHGIVVDSDGVIFVGDHQNDCIRRIAIE
jgi:hypothetical protein